MESPIRSRNCARFCNRARLVILAALLLILVVPADTRAQTVVRPVPAHKGDGVSSHPLLSWSYSEGTVSQNLLPNGGFEEGTNGWGFASAGVANSVRFRAPFEGTNVLTGLGSWVTRDLTLPDEPGGLRLSYVTLGLLGDPTLTLEMLDSAGRPELLPGGSVLSDGWRTYGADLTAHAGERVRLTWKFPSSDNVSWGLDDVQLSSVPAGTEFEVWLGNNPNGPFELLGRTRQSSWPLRFLPATRRFHWRVDTLRDGQIHAGPVWQFYTDSFGLLTELLVDPVPEWVCESQSLMLGLQLSDDDGFASPGSNGSRTVGPRVEAFGEGIPPPPVAATELNLMTDTAEFQNVGSETLNLSGWFVDLLLGGGGSGSTNAIRLAVPSGSLLAPGAVFQARRGNGGQWPDLTTNAPLQWNQNQRAAVILRDPAGQVVDCVFYSKTISQSAGSTRAGQARAVSASHWPGLPLTGTVPSNFTVQRAGHQDRNSADDWAFASASPMATNQTLSVPFFRGSGSVPVEAPTNSIATDRNGYFLLPVLISGPASNVVVTATALLTRSDQNSISGQTLPFTLAHDVCLSVELPTSVNEVEGTLPGALRVRIPSPRETNVTVSLRLPNGPVEGVTVPAEIIIPAGDLEAFGDLSVVNNTELTGPRSLMLFGTAFGFAPVQTPLIVDDDETATLRLELPATVLESEERDGILFVDPPPTRPVRVRLVSGNASRLWLGSLTGNPGVVTVEAGARETAIRLAAFDNSVFEGSTKVTARAEFANWTPAEAVVGIADDENNLLRLYSLDSPTIQEGGSTTRLQIVLGGLATDTVPVTLTVDPPGRVEILGSPEIPANENSSTVTVMATDDTLTNGLAEVTFHVSSPGWVDATLTLPVLDNDPVSFGIRLLPGPMSIGRPFEFVVIPKAIDGRPIANLWLPNLQCTLVGEDGSPLPGELFLMYAAADGILARFTSTSTGSGIRIRAELEGVTGESAPFAVWKDAAPTGLVALAHDAMRNSLYVVDPGMPLGVLDLNTGIRSETFPPLPYARQVAMADDGTTVYVCWQGGYELARVNASTRVVEQTWPVGSTLSGEPLTLGHFLPLPGQPNVLLVARNNFGNTELAIFDGTNARPVTVNLGVPRPISLLAGLLPGQVFAVSVDRIDECQVVSEGIQITSQPWNLELAYDRSARAGDSVFSRGLVLSGQVELVDPVLAGHAGTNPADFVRNSLAVDPESGRVAWYHGSSENDFRILDPFTLKEVWRAGPTASQELGALIPLGPHRWAALVNQTLRLETDEAPEPDPATDVAVTAVVMARAPEKSGATVRLTVENRGPSPARDSRLTFAFPAELRFEHDSVITTAISTNAQPVPNALGGQSYALGDLAPGGVSEIIVELRGSLDGRLDAAAWVGCAAADPNPENNRAAIHVDGLAPLFRLDLSGPDDSGQLSAEFETVTGWNFWLESSLTPGGPWEGIQGILGNGQPASLPLPAVEVPERFLRLRVSEF